MALAVISDVNGRARLFCRCPRSFAEGRQVVNYSKQLFSFVTIVPT
jgi:hypothetical protein